MPETTLFDINPADVADTSNDCFTPRWIFDAAGLTFDLDVAAPVDPARRVCPALRYLTPVEDGLTASWDGLVWMNPPYSHTELWVERFVAHRCGMALTPTWGENYWRGTLLASADAVALIYPVFTRPDGSKLRPIAACAIVGCGPASVDAVGRVARADKYAAGAYHVANQADPRVIRGCGGVQRGETKSAGQTTGGARGGSRLGNPCDEDGLTR